MSARGFAIELLAEMARRDQRAADLTVKSQRKNPVIGIEDEGEFVPILCLGAPSAKFSVMSLFVRHQGRWQPTFKRGTPRELALDLTGTFHYLWTVHVEMAGNWMDATSEDPMQRGRT